MKNNPNPQGKGLVPVLESLTALRTRIDIPAKQVEQIVCELFTSLFVLKGQFNFRPIVGHSYWLYYLDDILKLSLIAPEEWHNDQFGKFVGKCILQLDMTWTLTLSDQIEHDESFLEYLTDQRELFKQNLAQQSQLKQALPVFDIKLPFYQRVLASSLAYSLAVSIDKNVAAELEFKAVKAIELLPNKTAD